MSEPLSAVEIEDVLTSIRRLVSEDLRPVPRATAVPPANPPADVPRQALILTPALRVVSDAAPAQAAAVQTPVAAVPEVAVPEVATVPPAEDASPDEPDEALVAQATGLPATDVPDWARSGWAQSGADEIAFAAAPPPGRPAATAEPEWLDQAEADVIAGLQDDAAEPAVDLMEDAPEMSFDEEVLRDLVRDLIREELQGHLGERITRNIRKLVRAEIARALAAAELD